MDKQQFTKEVLSAELTLYRVARSILSSDEECADAIQSAILKAFEKISTLKENKYFKTWLVRILINECYQINRKKKAVILLEEYTADERIQQSKDLHTKDEIWMEEVIQEESEVFLALRELEDKYRIPLVLYYCEGYSTIEIAKILEVSTAVIKTRLFRGRRMMRDKLVGEYGYEG